MESPKSKPNPLSLPKLKLRRWSPQLAAVVLLLLLVAIGALPRYLTGDQSWIDLPRMTELRSIKSLQKTGLDVPSWNTVEQKQVPIGSQQWSIQLMVQNDDPVMLMLLPQSYYRDQPEVEWVDINGAESWKTDSYSKLNLSLEDARTKVNARFFRAWNRRQTFAVVQWYAWPSGGHFAPANWFWIDRFAQLRRRRVPWIAVCLKIPMKPLDNLETAEPTAEALAKTVQATLQAGPFRGQPAPAILSRKKQ